MKTPLERPWHPYVGYTGGNMTIAVRYDKNIKDKILSLDTS